MRLQTCDYVKPDGSRCGALALRGQAQCYFHQPDEQRGRPPGKQPARSCEPPFELPELWDFSDIQEAIQLVLDALMDGRLDSRAGAKLVYGLQLASNNLRRIGRAEPEDIEIGQVGLMHVMDQLLNGRITPRQAGRLFYALQVSMSGDHAEADLTGWLGAPESGGRLLQ